MSHKKRKALGGALPARTDYEVGYGKPPKETRFRPGVSGNPSGRPKGAKNRRPRLNEERLKDIILDEAYRTINVRDGDRQVSVPVAQAVVRTIAVNAAKGQVRAQELFAQLVGSTERANKQLYDQYLNTAIGSDWEQELERRKALGIEAPDPVPHPDDIEIDMRTGEVVIRGPMTKEEKARWDWLRERKAEFEAEVAELRQILRDEPDHEHREQYEADIAEDEKILAMMRKVLPD